LIRITAEHCAHRWVFATEVDVLLPTSRWLRKATRYAEAIRALSPAGLLDYYSAEGLIGC
jgi:hypothetical protein